MMRVRLKSGEEITYIGEQADRDYIRMIHGDNISHFIIQKGAPAKKFRQYAHCGREWESYVSDGESTRCMACGAQVAYVIKAPMVLQASYPDGTNRFRDEREKTRLKRARDVLHYQKNKSETTIEDLRKIGKEIDKLNGRKET